CGLSCIAGTLLRLTGARRGLRMSWLTVGIEYPRCSFQKPKAPCPLVADALLWTPHHSACRGHVSSEIRPSRTGQRLDLLHLRLGADDWKGLPPARKCAETSVLLPVRQPRGASFFANAPCAGYRPAWRAARTSSRTCLRRILPDSARGIDATCLIELGALSASFSRQ